MSTPVISTDSWSGNGASEQSSTNESSPGRALHIPPNQSEICISPFSDPPPPATCMGEDRWCVMQYHAGYIRSVLHSRHQSLNRHLLAYPLNIFDREKMASLQKCRECERRFCICDRNSNSSITLTSEDGNSREVPSRRTSIFGKYGEGDGGEEAASKALARNTEMTSRASDIVWEDWSLPVESVNGLANGDVDGAEFYSQREDDMKEKTQSCGADMGGWTHVPSRPILLVPETLFDSDLRVFFIRAVKNVVIAPACEERVDSDIVFHPHVTSRGVDPISCWAACVGPVPTSSPHFGEALNIVLIRGGSINLNIVTQKRLSVAMVNSSLSREVTLSAGQVIAVLEICTHRY